RPPGPRRGPAGWPREPRPGGARRRTAVAGPGPRPARGRGTPGGRPGPEARSPAGRVLALPGRPIGGQDLERPFAAPPAEDVDALVLEELVCLEEVLDLHEPMGPHLVEAVDVGLVRIGLGDAQDLVVGALLVTHLEDPDRAGPDVAAGERRLVDDQEGVGVVAVIGPGVLDE